jgi:general secretion pathway protein I
MMSDKRHKQSGVTLVETLVALAVIGFVIAGLLVLVGQNTRFAAAMEERTYASVAADNLMVEAMTLTSALELGETGGEITVGERQWSYRRSIVETGVEDVIRIEIDVLPVGSEQVLAHATSLRSVK